MLASNILLEVNNAKLRLTNRNKFVLKGMTQNQEIILQKRKILVMKKMLWYFLLEQERYKKEI
jgi:hypothetical protein